MLFRYQNQNNSAEIKNFDVNGEVMVSCQPGQTTIVYPINGAVRAVPQPISGSGTVIAGSFMLIGEAFSPLPFYLPETECKFTFSVPPAGTATGIMVERRESVQSILSRIADCSCKED